MIDLLTVSIAGKAIQLSFPVLPFVDHWTPFIEKNGKSPVIQTITKDSLPFAMPFYGVSFLREGLPGRIAQSIANPNAFISYNEDWSHVIAGGPAGEDMFELMITAFYTRLARLEPTMLLHASAVKHEGESVVFIGPSGIGKTTQAVLWTEYLPAEINNGDKVFLVNINDRPFACGSPWAGSSPYIVNDRAPVKGIVLLRQGSCNELEKLTNLYAFLALSKHTFFPQWDKLCTTNVIQMLNFVLKSTPVFLLTCKPDEDAVAIAKEKIWA
jgi:hypothetical protein